VHTCPIFGIFGRARALGLTCGLAGPRSCVLRLDWRRDVGSWFKQTRQLRLRHPTGLDDDERAAHPRHMGRRRSLPRQVVRRSMRCPTAGGDIRPKPVLIRVQCAGSDPRTGSWTLPIEQQSERCPSSFSRQSQLYCRLVIGPPGRTLFP
jgi:hypothetical protein